MAWRELVHRRQERNAGFFEDLLWCQMGITFVGCHSWGMCLAGYHTLSGGRSRRAMRLTG